MKVNRISFGEKQNTKNLQNPKHTTSLNPFLYLPYTNKKENDFNSTSFRVMTALLAAIAVGITLMNLRGRKTLPDKIVELADQNLGFNKINKYQRTVKELKSKILYPLKCRLMGDKIPAQSRDFKSGFILSHNNAEEVKEVMNAFTEHAKKLDIHCLSMPENLKRNEKTKWTYKATNIAKQHYERTGKHTIINLGNISSLTEMQNKSTKSRVENLLSAIDNAQYTGVVWTAWTDKPKQIPYFYNNLPILITKLMD